MNDKQMARMAHQIQQALLQLRKNRYLEFVRQVNLLAGKFQELLRESRKLGISLSRDWLAATEHCCKGIYRQLSDVMFPVGHLQGLLDRRSKETPQVAAVFAEIKALEAEFGEVEFNDEDNCLSVITEPITLEDVYLGPFRIALCLDHLGELHRQTAYFVTALEPHPAATDEAVTHPHISNEAVCEGDGGPAIRAALEAGRLCDFFTLIRSILQTYNPDSPYVSLADWYGVPCYDCGYVMDSDSSYYCSFCENSFCEECTVICASCTETVCKSCAGTCEICEQSICPTCTRVRCSQCESICCQSCLEDGLCPDCKEERDNHEEEPEEKEDKKPESSRPAEATAGGRVVGREPGAASAGAAFHSNGLGQASVLPGPVG